eukprot:347922-Chlamydomonas_euryale.AAC.1
MPLSAKQTCSWEWAHVLCWQTPLGRRKSPSLTHRARKPSDYLHNPKYPEASGGSIQPSDGGTGT